MNPPCVFCGGAAELRHHPTGRDASGTYLDPHFAVPICHDDHTLTHDDWYSLDVEATPSSAGLLDLIALSMRRLGLLCARLGAPGSVMAALARWFARNADLLTRAIASLDRQCPGWRLALPE